MNEWTRMCRLQSTAMTQDNMVRIREMIATLQSILQNVEKVSGDASSITGHDSTKNDIRNLIQAMSRIVNSVGS